MKDKTHYSNVFLGEIFTLVIFTILILLVSTFEYKMMGAHEYSLFDLSSVIIILAVFINGIVTGIFTSLICVTFSIIISGVNIPEVAINLFLTKIIFVLVLYSVYILIKDKFKKLETPMYVSISVAVIIKKFFTLAWLYATRDVTDFHILEHVLSSGLQIILYCGLVYLILNKMRKTVNGYVQI